MGYKMGFSGGTVVNNLPANAGDVRDTDSLPRLERPRSEKSQPTPVFLPRKTHGQKSLAGCNKVYKIFLSNILRV